MCVGRGRGRKLSATNPTDEEKKCRLWHTAYDAVKSNWNRKGGIEEGGVRGIMYRRSTQALS